MKIIGVLEFGMVGEYVTVNFTIHSGASCPGLVSRVVIAPLVERVTASVGSEVGVGGSVVFVSHADSSIIRRQNNK
jgi:hypothetical protein